MTKKAKSSTRKQENKRTTSSTAKKNKTTTTKKSTTAPKKATTPPKSVVKKNSVSAIQKERKTSKTGHVFRGITKYIDKEPKLERNYVVVEDNGKNVSVSKLKTIRHFDEKGKISIKI